MDIARKKDSSETITRLQRHRRVYKILLKCSAPIPILGFFLCIPPLGLIFAFLLDDLGQLAILVVLIVFLISLVTTLVSLGGLILTKLLARRYERRERSGGT